LAMFLFPVEEITATASRVTSTNILLTKEKINRKENIGISAN
jgi:hypothetical protein